MPTKLETYAIYTQYLCIWNIYVHLCATYEMCIKNLCPVQSKYRHMDTEMHDWWWLLYTEFAMPNQSRN